MFPIMNIAGKVIGFGGRTLKKDKDVAKYVNSPESVIYKKGDIIYGLYQAKREINKQDKCFIVEGYADVISMHQAGFKNVIASSGTALTIGHIYAIRRFTSNVTEMFDGDAAGVKAALRGVDMLLKEGFNIKVLPLSPEDDPDSFVRAHSFTEVEQYIQQHEVDFISFKSGVMLRDAQNDPIKRTAAITDVVKSIALIPDEIARMVYAKECSNLFDFDEKTILRQIKQYRGKYREQWRKEREQQEERERRLSQNESGSMPTAEDIPAPPLPEDLVPSGPSPAPASPATATSEGTTVQEREIIRAIVNYGMCLIGDIEHMDGTINLSTVLEQINNEIQLDQMSFRNPLYRRTFEIAKQYIEPFHRDLEAFSTKVNERTAQFIKEEMANQNDADPYAMDSASFINAQERLEMAVKAKANLKARKEIQEFCCGYLQKVLCSLDDNDVRQLACELATDDMPQLSKIHTKFAVIVEDRDKLMTLVPKLIYNWKYAIVAQRINETKERIAAAGSDEQSRLMKELQFLYKTRHQLAALIGERVVNPN